MALYALSIQPLITGLQAMSHAKQYWFVDDASGAGTIPEIKQWWDGLNILGPGIGYFPNANKCWIILKPEKEAINVTVGGQKHLGAVIVSRDYLQDYVNEKVASWVNEVAQLAEFAGVQPQASYAAYTFGLKHRWMYFLRTIPDIQDLLEPLEEAISQVLITAIVERKCSKLDKDVLALPVRLGGLGLSNPCHEAAREHASSIQVTSPLVEHIVAQTHQLPDESLIKSGHQSAKCGNAGELSEIAENLKQIVPRKTQRALELAQEKGSSVWLTVLPLQEQVFDLTKREFRDAVKLRYDWPFDDIPSVCACGENFTVDHAMICKRGAL